MRQEDKFEKITIDLREFGWGIRDVRVVWPKDHEGGTPGPDTVGTEQIVDGAVEEQDLNDSVKDRMTITYDSNTGALRLGGYAKSGNVPADDAGFDTGADDGGDDI